MVSTNFLEVQRGENKEHLKKLEHKYWTTLERSREQ